jgi:hypothetical protein
MEIDRAEYVEHANESDYPAEELKRNVLIGAYQQTVIDQTLRELRKYLQRKSLDFNMLTDEASAVSPKHWQIFSTYFRDLPPGFTITEDRIMDTIGYLIFLLAELRTKEGGDDWLSASGDWLAKALAVPIKPRKQTAAVTPPIIAKKKKLIAAPKAKRQRR